jgi:hypothetical protein
MKSNKNKIVNAKSAREKVYNMFTTEEKQLLVGSGFSFNEKKEIILKLYFDASNNKSKKIVEKWNNKKVDNLEINAELREVPMAL